MFSERKAKRGQTRVFVTLVTDVTRSTKNVAAVASPSISAPLKETVEHTFLRALKHCAMRVIVFPILGHLSTRPGHACRFQRQNQQNFDLPGC
jgi:hypothetical protein